MKIAIPVWDGQVSPVFDVARRVEVYELHGGQVTATSTHRLHGGRSVADLEALKIEILICSAISVEAEAAMRVAGIEVVSEICGPVETIVKALAAGDHKLAGFHSPAGRPRDRGRGLEAATLAVPQRPARRVTVASPAKGGRK